VVDWLASWMGHDAAVIAAPTWFTFAGISGLIAGVMVMRAARRQGADVALAARVILVAYLAAILGGITIPLVADALWHWLRSGAVRVRWAGMVSYCGFAAGLTAAYLLLRRSRTLSPGRFADLAAAPLGLGIASTRLGCFMAGCDYGQVSAAPWALRFPSGSPAWTAHVDAGLVPAARHASLPVHPTQLYEVLLGVLIFVIARGLARLPWARNGQGRVFWAVAAVYGAGRLVIEMFRGDVSRGLLGDFSSGQIFALLLIAASLAMLRRVQAGRPAALAAALALLVMLPASRVHADEAAPAPRVRAGVGALLGTAVPINRRSGQIPQLSGGSLTASVSLGPGLDVGVDLDSLANDLATHVSLGVFAGSLRPIRSNLRAGVRGGIGGTLVGFAEPSFRDVLALNLRVEAQAEWLISDRWRILVRPVSLDFLGSSDLGGPILTYQFRVGVAFHFGIGRQASQSASAPAQPAQPAPAQPVGPAPAEPAPAGPAPAEPAPAQPEELPLDPWAPPPGVLERLGSRMLL
jgi:phosphatidylglycerol:prolipoprotein diacylglycerol transferase